MLTNRSTNERLQPNVLSYVFMFPIHPDRFDVFHIQCNAHRLPIKQEQDQSPIDNALCKTVISADQSKNISEMGSKLVPSVPPTDFPSKAEMPQAGKVGK